MHSLTKWSPEMDNRLRHLRGAGESWDAIAAMMGLTRWTTIERGRRLGARRPPPPPRPVGEDPNRPPLPAGHPVTWGLLTDGTLLDGAAYPYPVFTR
jgi:hypothetical protein